MSLTIIYLLVYLQTLCVREKEREREEERKKEGYLSFFIKAASFVQSSCLVSLLLTPPPDLDLPGCTAEAA